MYIFTIKNEYMGKLPIFNAYINNVDDGIVKISLVDDPAVESFWLAYNENKQPLHFSVQDEDERRILGVVMRADFLIYRYNESIGEYYIRYSKETIKQMAEKLMVDGYQNKINLMHEDGTDVDGVNLVQLFIKDSEKGISPAGFEDIEEGSLFAEYKVENEDIWGMIKDGTFKGFSLEGYFTVEKEIEEFNKINKKNKNIMSKLKEMLARMLAEFGAIGTDKGTLAFEGEEITEGIEVTLEDGSTPADGEYTAEDGRVITIKDGKVESIKEAEKPAEEEKDEETPEKQEFNKIKTQFEATYQEVQQNIYAAIDATGVYGYLVENTDEYAIVSVWGEDNTEHLYRYQITIGEDGTVTLGEMEEVKVSYVPTTEEETKPEVVEEEMSIEEETKPEETTDEETTEKTEPTEIDELKAEIEALKTEIENIKSTLETIANTPASEPIAEEFKKAATVETTGDAKLDRRIKKFAALKA